ncbi:hypothetical protein PHYSODRAFT_338052 [Phytophthora sojae]|uniref:Uncharacterized protein n=1 Tax=Phytophthora sojae (strain P6497) TaxID=1094619 RepID=G5A0F0_PHYSP|nr:hypothetical protein PHYSODRAFT_338052 [Phytophthora sojae]EGZ11339.1 hypothetical protein PHYSODRAFT_338052 [Phytophthora sojae]|eukprot:XP_009534084.1 hypothetical protein PHYSODRAFT_338052 [Phytophthora sojae]
MKIVRPAVFIVVGFAAKAIDPAAGSNGVGAYYDDSTCTKTLLAKIDAGACQDDSGCKAYQSMGISIFCIEDPAEYLKTAFAGSPYFVAVGYNDAECEELVLTRAFLADGECHVGHEDDDRAWGMTTTVSGDGTVAVLGTDDKCGGPNPFYFQDPVSKSDLNTGDCVVIPDNDDGSDSYGAKFYFVDPSTQAPPDTTTSTSDSSDSSTDDDTTMSGTGPSGSSTNDTTSSTDPSGSSTDSSTNTTGATATPAATNATTGSTSDASNLLAVSLVIYASVALGAAIL